MRALVLLIVAVGCDPGPAYRPPEAPLPRASAYKEWKLAAPADAIPRGAWWTMFHDAELDALEARVAVGNQTIARAVDAYTAARAEVRGARADYFPTVSAGASTTHVVGTYGTNVAPYAIALDASWMPDLFGRVRATVRTRELAAQAIAADVESTRLVVQAALAQTLFALRGQDALQQLLDATTAADAQVVELVRSRYERGLDTEVAYVQAQQTLETARVAAAAARAVRAQYEHAIGTLVGVPATDLSLAARPLDAAPPAVPVALPSQLLERRPDIAAAERRMAAANAQIGVGYAAYYPQLALSGGAGFASGALASLLSWPSAAWSLGASLVGVLFDGGKRGATIDEYRAQYDAAVASYRQTVLTAVQEVEDDLAAVTTLDDELAKALHEVALAERAFALETSRYEAGLDSYLPLMVQQQTLLAARRSLVAVEVERMTSAVSLITALGGGWERT